MRKGDIVRGRITIHPIIFLRRLNLEQFVGCLLTHSNDSEYPDNIELRPEHFLHHDRAGIQYQTQYDNSYLVAIELIKDLDWGPFTKTGQLSQEGIFFVEDQLQVLEPQKWEDYLTN